MEGDAKETRAWLHRALLAGVVYERAPESGVLEEYNANSHIAAMTLMGGIHLPSGATSFADATPAALHTLSTLANGHKHLEPDGKLPLKFGGRGGAANKALRLAQSTLRCDVKLVVEVIPSIERNAAGKRVCAGVHLMWLSHEHGNRGGRNDDDGGNDNGVAANGVAGPGGRAAPRARGRAPGTDPELIIKLNREGREALLAVGLAKSFAEAEQLRIECGNQRSQYIKANTSAKKGVLVATNEAQHRIKDAHTIPEYRFGAYETMENFLFNAVQPYYSVPDGCNGAVPEHDPGNGFLDLYPGCDDISRSNNRIAENIRLKQLAVPDYYLDPASPMHPDHIFCLERALAYFARDGNHSAAPEACCLDSYIPGAYGRNVPAARGAAAGAADAALPPMPRIDEAIVEDDDDDNNDNDADNDNADAEANEDEADADAAEAPAVNAPLQPPQAPQANTCRDLRRFMYDSGQPLYHTVARPSYPFPHLTYQVNSLATYAEILTTIIPLPYPIGAELPDEAFAPVGADELRPSIVLAQASTIELTLALKVVERMRRGEEAIAQAEQGGARGGGEDGDNGFSLHRRRLPSNLAAQVSSREMGAQRIEVQEVVNAPEQTQNIMDVIERYQDMGVPIDRQREGEELREEGHNGIPPALVPVMEHHIKVVRKALAALATRFRRCQYAEMNSTAWTQVLEPESNNGLMPPSEFYPPRSVHDGSELTQVQALLSIYESSKGDTPFKPEQKRMVLASVDIFPDWQIERSEALEQRQRFQMSEAIMLQKHKLELERIMDNTELTPDQALDQKMETKEKHAAEYDEWQTLAWKKYDEVYYSTDRLSPAQKAVRDYTKQHIIPNRDKATVRQRSFDVRTYAVTRQFYTDTYRSCELATKTNAVYMERVHTCGHHGFRWMSRRDDPALNYTMYGESGAGKSHALLVCSSLIPKGVVSETTSETLQSYNVDQDFDGHIVIYQEMSSDLLFAQRNKNDQGSSERINFAKARMTSFFTQTKFFKSNDQTGKREADFCFSSQHIVTLGATNQTLESMDKNMRRRLVIDIYAESPAESEGGHPGQLNQPESDDRFAGRTVAEQTRADHRELFSAYAYLEGAIKMGAVKDVVSKGGKAFLDWILRNAEITIGGAINSKGAKNWILEAARILSLQHACYMSLFSPTAFYLHEHTDLKRWTPLAFQYFTQPQMFILKDAIIHAYTMLDFLYTSLNEDRLLATIALSVLHVDEPARWRLRRKIGGTHDEPLEDPNYVSFTAATIPMVGQIISDQHRQVAKLRPEDVRSLLQKYENQKRSSLGFAEPARGETGTFVQAVRRTDRSGVPEERPTVIYERDPTSKAKQPPMQFSMSLEFFENRFGIDLTRDSPAEIRRKIEHHEKRLDADLFRNKDPTEAIEALREIVACYDTRAPLVASVRKALRMPTLEMSPYEHPDVCPLHPSVFRYWTFYMPEDVFLRFDGMEKRIPVDGVCTYIEGVRDPDGTYLMQENFTKPLPTARTSLYNISVGTVEKTPGPEMSRGFIFDKYDFDYYGSDTGMTRQGHPGIPLLHNVCIDAYIFYRDYDRYPDPDAYREVLFDAVPLLDPAAGVPLPFAFGPLAYMIERYLAEEIYKWPQDANYPMSNVYDRLKDSVERIDGQLTNNANNAFEAMSKRYDFDERQTYANRKRARAHAAQRADARNNNNNPTNHNNRLHAIGHRPNKRRRIGDNEAAAQPESPSTESIIDAMDIDEPEASAAARLVNRHLGRRQAALAASPNIYRDSEDGDIERLFV